MVRTLQRSITGAMGAGRTQSEAPDREEHSVWLESQTSGYSWPYGEISPVILFKVKKPKQHLILDSSRRIRTKHGFAQPLHKARMDNLHPSQSACSRHAFSSYRLTVCPNCLLQRTGIFCAPVFIPVIAEKILALHQPSFCHI